MIVTFDGRKRLNSSPLENYLIIVGLLLCADKIICNLFFPMKNELSNVNNYDSIMTVFCKQTEMNSFIHR